MPAQESVRLFSACQADLGESPVWDEISNALLFVDISRGQINALDEQANLTRLHQSSSRVGALALTNAGNLIFTREAGVAILDRASLQVSRHSPPASTLPSYRFNDGACDPQGRFITGLMDEAHSKNSGKLYRYDAGLNASVVLENIGLPNGLVWSADGGELFLSTRWPAPCFAPDIRPPAPPWKISRCLPIHRRPSVARMAWPWTLKGASGCASSMAAACSGTIATAS